MAEVVVLLHLCFFIFLNIVLLFFTNMCITDFHNDYLIILHPTWGCGNLKHLGTDANSNLPMADYNGYDQCNNLSGQVVIQLGSVPPICLGHIFIQESFTIPIGHMVKVISICNYPGQINVTFYADKRFF